MDLVLLGDTIHFSLDCVDEIVLSWLNVESELDIEKGGGRQAGSLILVAGWI